MTDSPTVAEMEYEDGEPIGIAVNEDWWEMSKEEYINFDSFKQHMMKNGADKNIVNYDKSDGIGGLISNPPGDWFEREDEEVVDGELGFLDMRLGIIRNLVRDKALKSILDREMGDVGALVESGEYKTAIIRQSAFFEEYLVMTCVVELGWSKGESLSNEDLGLIEQMGHSDRIRLARILRVIEEEQHQRLQEMASMRNEIAHTPWTEFSEDNEQTIQRIATKSFEVMTDLLASMDEKLSFY